MQGRNAPGGLDSGTGTAHDLETLSFQKLLEPPPDEFVIVEDEHTDEAGVHVLRGGT
ncbi:hypothetical protein D9M72_421110 [compost metagenome]